MIKGECLCGKVQIEIEAVSQDLTICHCSMCMKFFGGPMIGLMGVSADSVVNGQEYLCYYDSSEWAQRGFCQNCGSSLCYRSKEGGELYFAAGLFETLPDFAVKVEICVDQKASYLAFQPGTQRLTMKEYLAQFVED